MATIITDLKESFRRGNIYIQLIYINVGVFIFTTLTGVILQLFNRSLGGVFEWLELPASLPRFIIQPWSVLTYMFMHAGVLHILFNMLWLYWFGALFLNFFSARHLRGVYILGGICGGLLYMTAYNIFPYFRPMTEYSFMLGASASVLAIVAATAYREPDYPIRLFLFGTVRLKYLALVVIVTDLLFITSSNAGGHIAHLGGALAGLWFAASLSKGADINGKLGIAGMADKIGITIFYGGNHRLCMAIAVARRKNGLMESGNNQIHLFEHSACAINFALRVFNVGFNATQNSNVVHHAWPHTHIHKMPIMRRISHIRTVVSDGKQFDSAFLCLSNIIVEGAIGVGACHGVHM